MEFKKPIQKEGTTKVIQQKAENSGVQGRILEDNRPEAFMQQRFQESMRDSPDIAQSIQTVSNENSGTSPLGEPIQKKENNTGLPDTLKSGIENLSGMTMDDVNVHRNSDKPAQLNAHAYAQGSDIHLGPGQEKHLPHEAWHVVQQKQGRVKPTLQMKGMVNVNDDEGLEKEADMMGSKAMTVQRFSEQNSNGIVPISKSKIETPDIVQMRWINVEGTNQSYWEGRNPPTQEDIAQLVRAGRIQVDYVYNAIPNAPSAHRPHGLFLASHSTGRGEIGAPFPLPPPSPGENIPQSTHHENVSWFHPGSRVQHSEPRRSERTIHGGVSARERLRQFGLPDYERAAWAHTQPDHATPIDQDREDRRMRHPSTEQANQQHTVREYAQMDVARRLGGIIASRHLHGEQPGRPGLFSELEFQSTFLTGTETRTHSDSVPYFTQQPGRYGDEDDHAQMLGIFGVNALASGLRDQGFLSQDDLPDQFYIPADGIEADSEDGESESILSLDDESQDHTSIGLETASSGLDIQGGAGRPIIAPAPPNSLTLEQMDDHYHEGNVWAGNQGTFSHEFSLFRYHPLNVFNILVQGGLFQADANALAAALQNALDIVSDGYLHENIPVPDYLPPPIQNWVFDNIDAVHGRSLWALLRYLH